MGKMIVSDLTDRLVMARAVILLVEEKVLPRGKAMQAAQALGVDKEDLAKALKEYNPRNRHAFKVKDLSVKRDQAHRRVQVQYPESQTSPTVMMSDGKLQRHTRNRRLDADGNPERRCIRCKKWLPATPEFWSLRDAKTKRLRSDCRECYNANQRATYLTNAQREMIEGVVRFVTDENDKIVGITCAKCGDPIEVGDEIETSTDVRHTSCSTH